MGFVAFTGPIGLTVSATYFVVDATVGWDNVGNVIESSYRMEQETRTILENAGYRYTGHRY